MVLYGWWEESRQVDTIGYRLLQKTIVDTLRKFLDTEKEKKQEEKKKEEKKEEKKGG